MYTTFWGRVASLPELLRRRSRILLVYAVLLARTRVLPSAFSPIVVTSHFIAYAIVAEDVVGPAIKKALARLAAVATKAIT